MIYKIYPIPSGEPDTILLSDTILTVNSVDYDLKNLDTDSSKPVYKQEAIYATDDNGDPTDDILQEEMTHIKLVVPENRMFMFVSVYGRSNLYRFFDIDGNGIINLTELNTVIDYINNDDDDSLKADLQTIYDAHIDAGGTKESWMKG